MILDGYYLDVLPDGSIILDPEIKPGLLQVLAGDEFVVIITTATIVTITNSIPTTMRTVFILSIKRKKLNFYFHNFLII